MFESDTYYHPRLDLWPKVLLRWATALTEYPQSWTCLNIRHVDSLRLGNPLFLLRHHSYTVGSGLCITPIQTLAETPYCLNKWVRLAFICQENWGGALRIRSLVHVRVGVPPSSERGEVLKHVKIVHVSTQTWTMNDEHSSLTPRLSAPHRHVLSTACPWISAGAFYLYLSRRADFCFSGGWMILTEKTHLTPWSWFRVNEDRLCRKHLLSLMKRACWDEPCAFYAQRANQTVHIWGSLSARSLASTLIGSNYKLHLEVWMYHNHHSLFYFAPSIGGRNYVPSKTATTMFTCEFIKKKYLSFNNIY